MKRELATLAQGQECKSKWEPALQAHSTLALQGPGPKVGSQFPGECVRNTDTRASPRPLGSELAFGSRSPGDCSARLNLESVGWAIPWGSQSSLGGSFSPFPVVAPKADNSALISWTLKEKAGWLDFVLPVGQAALFILIAPWSSRRLRNNIAICFPGPHTPAPSPHQAALPGLPGDLLSSVLGS